MGVLDTMKAALAIANTLGNHELLRELRALNSELDRTLEDNRRLKAENEGLVAQLEKRAEMVWDQERNAYYKTLPGEQREGPYCPSCWDGKRKQVRMSVEHWGFTCTVCEHVIRTQPPTYFG